jgi:hypothetical protein
MAIMTIQQMNVITGEVTIIDEDAPSFDEPQAPMITKAKFVEALTIVEPPMFTRAEAADALQRFPPKFSVALADKPFAYEAAAVQQWQTITLVPRDAPLLLDLLAWYAAQAGLTDAQAVALGDAIFEAGAE